MDYNSKALSILEHLRESITTLIMELIVLDHRYLCDEKHQEKIKQTIVKMTEAESLIREIKGSIPCRH